MNDDLYPDIVASLKRVTKSPKPYAWFFCAQGDDGKPVLLVGKRAGEVKAQGKELKKTAKDKKGGRGRLLTDEKGNLVFCLDEGNAPVKSVQKAMRLKLAMDPGLKKVKGLLQKSRVLTGEDANELFGESEESETEETVDTGKLQKQLEKARGDAKDAYEAAVGRVGKGHDDLAELLSLQGKAKAAREEGLALLAKGTAADAAAKLAEARDLYEELAEGAATAGLEIAEDADEGTEAEDEEDPDEADADDVDTAADPAELFELWVETMDAANAQIDSLRKALLASGDKELEDIADKGLPALTKGHRVPLQAALVEAKSAPADKRATALKRVATLAAAFLDHVENDEIFDACDDNPFGVKVALRKTLQAPLRRLSRAA